MTSLQSRVERLESKSTAGTVAAVLGGMAVVEHTEDGRVMLPGGEVVTEDELNARLAGCTGRLLYLDLE